MINLITGLPGNGKTLYALSYVKQWAEKDNRPVYYAGIKDLMLPWTEIDPTKWFECPANSIIVIDECQTVFRPRSVGKEPPDYVAKLETHRHQGLDIVLITQHPLLADSAIRRLVGKHIHVVRTFGTERATLHEWASVRENCDKPAGRSDSIKHHWAYPKDAYSYYKSAEVHTVKRNIPMRLYLLIAIPVFLIGCVFYFKHFAEKQKHINNPTQEETTGASKAVLTASSEKGKVSYKNAIEDAKQFVFEETPRVVGLPQTAPRYDELTKPVEVPVPAGCVQSSHGCKCYTQQATSMDVEESLCMEIVKHGFFEDFERSARKKEVQPKLASNQPRDDQRNGQDNGEPVGHGWVSLGDIKTKRMVTDHEKAAAEAQAAGGQMPTNPKLNGLKGEI